MIKKTSYIILSFFLTRVLFIGIGFNTLINLSKNNVLLSSILGMLLGLIVLYIFYKKISINKYILSFMAIVLMISIVITNVSLTSNFLLLKTPVLMILLVFMIFIIYGSSKNMLTTSRISSIIICPTIMLMVFTLWGLSSLVEFNNLFPLFNTNIIDFIIATLSFMALSVIPNILLINYKNKLNFRDVSLGYVIGSLFVIVLMFYIISIYGYDLAIISKYPEYLILKKVFIVSNINNVENILILESLSCIFITSLVCANVLKDNLSNKIFYVVLLLISIIVLLSLHEIFYLTILIQKYSNYLYLGLIAIALIIPNFKLKRNL